MSNTPQVTQSRRVVTLASGSVGYEVATTVTDPGDLPTSNLFVLTINDAGDAKRDALARVVEPYDLRRLSTALYVRVDEDSILYISPDTFARVPSGSELIELAQDRTDAVRRNQTEYLSGTVVLTYTSRATADAAYRQLITRLSALVVEWREFNASFETRPTTVYSLPVADASVEAERRAVYTAAVSARRAAEAAHEAASDACDACETDCVSDKKIHELLQADVAFLERARARVLTISETITGGSGGTPSHNAQDFCVRLGAYTADVNSYEVLLFSKRDQLAAYTETVRACQTRCAQLARDRDAAQATLSRALDAERRALVDVRAVCPTFTPTE